MDNVMTSNRVVVVENEITRPNDVNAYAAGDAISEVTTNNHFDFGALKPTTPNSRVTGRIVAARIVVGAKDTIAAMDLHCFHTDIGEDADNAAWTPTDAELKTAIATISFAATDFKDGDATAGAGGNQIGYKADLNIPFSLTVANTLFAQLVARAAYTPIASTPYQAQLVLEID